MSDRPLILVSNDDGIDAPGNVVLRHALRVLGDVVTVAPEQEQSATSHSISLHRPLRHRKVEEHVHAIDGTPADCIYVALYRQDLLPRRPDVVVSGINHGPNLGSDVFYSGTVAAAREGALRGIPAIALSNLGPDMEHAASISVELCARLLGAKLPADQAPLLNVNFPPGSYRGIRATTLGTRHYAEGVDVREDPRGREYFWIGGPGGVRHEPREGTDTDAADQGYVSVTPLGLHATHTEHQGLAAWVAGPTSEVP